MQPWPTDISGHGLTKLGLLCESGTAVGKLGQRRENCLGRKAPLCDPLIIIRGFGFGRLALFVPLAENLACAVFLQLIFGEIRARGVPRPDTGLGPGARNGVDVVHRYPTTLLVHTVGDEFQHGLLIESVDFDPVEHMLELAKIKLSWRDE